MGQNASRQRPADIDPHSVPASTPSDRSPEVPQDRDTQPTLEQHTDTPRSSVRKSVLNFMRPSTLRSRVSSVASSSGDARRSWRNSRRWSKAPEDPANVVSSSPATSSASSSSSGLSTAPTSTIDRRKQPERNVVIESDSRNCDVTFDPDNPPSSATSSILQPQPDYAASSSRSGPPEHLPPLPSEQPQTEDDTRHCDTTALGTPTDAPDTLHTRPQTPQPLSDPRPEPASNRPTQPGPQPQRQFPPPGTLVVVQGIVHTTDVSRTNPEPNPALSRTAPTPPPGPSPPLSSSETEVNTGRTRNRLSALLRPRSSSSRPSSTHIPDPPPLSVSSPDLSPITSSDDHPGTPPTTLPAGSEDDSRTHDYPSGPDQGHENRSSISSSSIDVLGTLLSVAAAATAASLLTGSSEPILSSGLTPGAASTNSSPPSAATAVPPLPTPHVHPTNPSPPSPLHDSSVAGRTERMRQAWGTIRERLGLRPSPSADQRRPSDEALGAAPTDTRELMLAEMARAFNIGLGLNGLGGTQAQASSGAEGSAGEDVHHHALPPEGSFERFLVDLQIDLRTALTSPDDDENASDDASEDSDHESGSDIPPSVPVDVGAGRQEESSHRPLPSIPSIEINDESGSHPRPPGFSEMDSEDESDDEESVSESDSEDEQDFHSAHASNGGNAALGGDPTHTSGRIDSQGRINWWRLYRFPPIQSPRSGLHGSPPSSNPHQAQSSDSAPLQPTPSAPSFSDPLPFASVAEPPNHPNTGDSTAPSDADHPEPSAPFPAPPPLTSVVPVIVVGLQSVTSDWRPEGDAQQDHAGATHEGTDPFGMTHQHEDSLHTPASHMDDGDFDTFGQHQHHQQDLTHGSPYAPMSSNPESGSGGPTQSTRSRTRGWQHRAANAIRNLRPGRRSSNNNATQQPTNPAGSRTFLIYVIGGYYPPDHSIVTGGPHNFDSFEALLELADLLGQVKPPTVSKDDIEKSGLELIKPAQIQAYETAGKIASNCVDRCLICLDDYEAEQELRVMTCRHAFHRVCVDEWLQKGRNNCPACRSTGVTVDPLMTNATAPTTAP